MCGFLHLLLVDEQHQHLRAVDLLHQYLCAIFAFYILLPRVLSLSKNPNPTALPPVRLFERGYVDPSLAQGGYSPPVSLVTVVSSLFSPTNQISLRRKLFVVLLSPVQEVYGP